MNKPTRSANATTLPPTWSCLRIEHKGKSTRVILDISVSPNAKKTELVGWHDGALRVRLSAPPVDGAANEVLRRWLSEQLQWALELDEAQASAWLASQSVLKSQGDDN
jgi:uncharacterized protein